MKKKKRSRKKLSPFFFGPDWLLLQQTHTHTNSHLNMELGADMDPLIFCTPSLPIFNILLLCLCVWVRAQCFISKSLEAFFVDVFPLCVSSMWSFVGSVSVIIWPQKDTRPELYGGFCGATNLLLRVAKWFVRIFNILKYWNKVIWEADFGVNSVYRL